ncbi:MAG: NADH-quinone oxidoreductase subunit K [Verrucomicrobium sp.]|nr:NADH-quinone oxidoreductase subunit K [Verrucomicrobium sp.]
MTFHAYAAAAAFLFFLGIFGMVARRNLFAQLLSLQLLFAGAALLLAAFSRFRDRDGAVLAVFVLMVAAVWTAAAAALLGFLQRRRRTIRSEDFTTLKF